MNGFTAIVSNTFGWIGMFALAGGTIGAGLYTYRAWRGATERGVSPTTWLTDDAWATPTRSILATLYTIGIIISIFVGAPTWMSQLVLAAVVVASVGMTPPAYRGGTTVSCVIGLLPFVAFAATTLMAESLLLIVAATLIVGALLRALLGIPDAAYYQQTAHTAKPKHLVYPGRDPLRTTLTEHVHGQTAAVVQTTDAIEAAASVCSPASKRPLVLTLAGPESCGRRRLAEVTAGALQGPFVQPNDRLDATGDAFYSGVKALRFNGHGCVLFLEGVETSPKGAQFLADVILRGHPDQDDWSKVLVIIPVVASPADMPAGASQKALADVLGGKIDRRLLAASIIVPMAALDSKGKAKVATQVALDLGKLNGVEIRSVDKDALYKLVSEADKEIEGANSVRIAVDHALHRRLETAQLRGVKAADVRLGADGDYELVPINA